MIKRGKKLLIIVFMMISILSLYLNSQVKKNLDRNGFHNDAEVVEFKFYRTKGGYRATPGGSFYSINIAYTFEEQTYRRHLQYTSDEYFNYFKRELEVGEIIEIRHSTRDPQKVKIVPNQ